MKTWILLIYDEDSPDGDVKHAWAFNTKTVALSQLKYMAEKAEVTTWSLYSADLEMHSSQQLQS